MRLSITLAATNPVATALYVTSDGNGELVVAEMVPQVPGQMNMDGTQQEAPKLLKLVQHAYWAKMAAGVKNQTAKWYKTDKERAAKLDAQKRHQ